MPFARAIIHVVSVLLQFGMISFYATPRVNAIMGILPDEGGSWFWKKLIPQLAADRRNLEQSVLYATFDNTETFVVEHS